MSIEAAVGVHLEVEVEGGSWYPATVAEVGDQRVRYHITGWGDNTDKWAPARSKKLRLPGGARRIDWVESSLRAPTAGGAAAAAAAAQGGGSSPRASPQNERNGSARASPRQIGPGLIRQDPAQAHRRSSRKRQREGDGNGAAASGERRAASAAAAAGGRGEPRRRRGITGPPPGAPMGTPEQWPGRDSQRQLLHELLCGPPGPAIFVHGPPATGKTGVLHEELQNYHDGCPPPERRKTVLVDCVECSSQRALLDCILSQLPPAPSRRGGRGGRTTTGWVRSQTGLSQLLELLREVCFGRQYRITIVFDRAERLRGMDQGLLAAFLAINELVVCGDGDKGMSNFAVHTCGQPDVEREEDAPDGHPFDVGVDVILVSENEWRTFRDTDTGTGLVEPTVVSFPAYSKKDLVEILVMNWKADSAETAENDQIEQDTEATSHALGILRGFVDMMLDVFYPVCRDLLELQRLLREMLPKVVAAQLHQLAEHGAAELHAIARPVLREALQRQFYSVCALSVGDSSAPDGAAVAAAAATGDDRDDRRTKSTVFDLPLYTKYLLVAAYLASHVQPKNDKLYFTRAGMTKARRRKPSAAAQGAEGLVHMQPNAFPLERLMAIFEALHPSTTGAAAAAGERGTQADDLRGAEMLAQVTSLVQLRLLVAINSGTTDVRLESCRYKCNVDHATTEQLALSFQPSVDLKDYFK